MSLELAKKLKELGAKQESYCYWREGNKEDQTFRIVTMVCCKGGTYSAFTVAELGEMLPDALSIDTMRLDNARKWFWTIFADNEYSIMRREFKGRTEADARAKLLIHLIEEGIIKTK